MVESTEWTRAKILLIDDVPANLQVFCAALGEDYEIQIAASGEVGLELANQEPPDLILLDIMMPGLDGFETCRKLKADPRLCDVPLIFITAMADLESETLGLTLGAADYIIKPINIDLARLRIRNLLEREVMRRELQLALARQRLAAQVFWHANEGVIICDAQNRILDVNPTFTEVTGYSREEVLGRNPSVLSSERHDKQFFRDMWASIQNTGCWRGEVWNRRKDGEVWTERLNVSTVHDEKGDVCNYIGIFSDVTLLRTRYDELEHLAHYDALTQLPNRLLLADRLEQGLAHSRRVGKKLALCYLDLDEFKPVNDRYGHEAGDRLLVEVARILKAGIRGADTVARLGGDEFVLLLLDQDDEAQCRQALTRIVARLAQPIVLPMAEVSIYASIGVAMFTDDGEAPDELMHAADQAMYRAKERGRNQICFAAELSGATVA